MKLLRTNRDDIYISPVLIVQLFDDTRREVGDEEIFTSRKYKVLREGWVASQFAIALSMYEGGVWWLRPNPEDIAPDFFAFNTKAPDEKGYVEGVNANFEVFEWGKKSEDTLLEAITKKIKNWKAGKISVVCYASKADQKIDLKSIYEELKKREIGVLNIFILANDKRLGAYYVAQVYPNLQILPVPNGVPSYFTKPFSFMSKRKGKGVSDGGKVGLNSEMKITIYETQVE